MRTAILSILLPVVASAQSAVEYDLTFDNAVHHEARITATFTDITDDTLELRMSRSSPGRYALHEFSKNVYNVWVVNGEGEPLTVTRPDPYQWNVSDHGGTVSVTYTLYADRAGGTYSGIDLTHAHLNMPATFMWARGFDKRPVRVTFSPADPSWKVATQLVPTSDPMVFTAPDLQYFLDSPTELSDFSLRSWQVESDGNAYTLRLAVHHEGSEEDVDKFAAMARKVVTEQGKIFGAFPEFDYGTYTFIADYLPYVSGDGMEHRNSTILTNSQSFVEADFSQLGTLSHEFMHAWNVERIRPVSLEPFNFERVNMSSELWFAEGFTSYYGVLAMRRAGETGNEQFLAALSNWIDTVVNAPGQKLASPSAMSRQAAFVDAASAIDPTNFDNTFVSYYTYGAALGVALDLMLRERFDGISLDSLMQQMWKVHGVPERPYTQQDIQVALATVTGNERFAAEFFANYIDDNSVPDFAALLANAGFVLQAANPDKASLGPVSLEFEGKDAIIASNTHSGSPLYTAGLDRGDQIIAVDRLNITSEERWQDALQRYRPGDTASIRFLQRGYERSAEISFIEDPAITIGSDESTGKTLDSAADNFRSAWLSPDSR